MSKKELERIFAKAGLPSSLRKALAREIIDGDPTGAYPLLREGDPATLMAMGVGDDGKGSALVHMASMEGHVGLLRFAVQVQHADPNTPRGQPVKRKGGK